MPECGGTVVIQATTEIFNAFKQDRDEGLEAFVAFTGADESINDDCDVFFQSLDVKGDNGCFEFENDYWLQTANRLASTAKNIGIYLVAGDEYGAKFYLAQNPQGQRFSFYAGGPEDDFENEAGDMVTDENLQQWLAVVPESIQKDFPQLMA